MHSMGAHGSQEPKTILHSENDPVNNSAEHSAVLHISAIAGRIVANTILRGKVH